MHDVAVAGCGPAGLASALLLHRAGHRVRIFERFEAPKPVGSGLILQPVGMAVLAQLGLAEKVASLGARLDRLHGLTEPSRRVALSVTYAAIGHGLCGLGVHRATLFDALYGAAQDEGIEIVGATPLVSVERSRGRPAVVDANGRAHGPFDLVVDALGAHSPLAPRNRWRPLAFGALWATLPLPAAGFDPHALEQRYARASRMAGVLPIGRMAQGGPELAAFFWSLKDSDLPAWKERGLEAWKADVRALWPATAPLLDAITAREQLTFAGYGHHTLRRPWGDAIVHIGDAAHSTSPQLGQGANMALLDALALARALDQHRDLPAALADYAAMRRWHVRIFQTASALFTPFYQSDSHVLPLLRDWVAAPLSRLPIADAVLARLVAGQIAPPLAGERLPAWRGEA